MTNINACGSCLNIPLLDALAVDLKAYETLLLVGHAAQQCSYRIFIESLTVQLVKLALTFPFHRRDSVPIDRLQAWSFDGQSVLLLGEIRALAVPMGFEVRP